jgi:hypothetical protein
MNTENLFFLIHSLSTSEKTLFRKSIRGKRQSQDVILYDRINSCTELNGNTERVIRGTEFETVQKYYKYKGILAEKIVKSIVLAENPWDALFPFMQKCVLADMPELALKALNGTFEKAMEVEDFDFIRYCYRIVRNLSPYSDFEWKMPEEVPNPTVVNSIIELHEALEDLVNQIKDGFKLPQRDRDYAALRIESRLNELIAITRSSGHLRTKVNIGIQLLRQNREAALRYQEQYVKSMAEWPKKYPLFLLVKEFEAAAKISALLDERSKALLYTWKIEAIRPQNRLEARQVMKIGIDLGIRIGEYYNDIDLVEASYRSFLENLYLFSGEVQSELYYLAGVTHFYQGNYSEAIQILSLLRQKPSKERERISWETQALLTICHLELENDSILDSLLDSLAHAIQKFELEYPRRVLQAIANTIKLAPHLPDFAIEVVDIKLLLNRSDENRSAMFLNIIPWMESKMTGMSQSEIIKGFEGRVLKFSG